MKPLHNEGDIIRCRSCGGPAVRQSLFEVHYCNDCRPIEIENEETPIGVIIHNEDTDVPKSDNELIAEFMGGAFYGPDDLDYPNKWFFPIQPHEGYRKDAHHITSGLRYNIDWSWLMPVVEKIRIQRIFVQIMMDSMFTDPIAVVMITAFMDKRRDQTICSIKGINALDTLYEAVVEFIKWYNMQPKP